MTKDNNKNRVLVRIMDQEYVIKGNEQPEYIEALAELVNEKMQLISIKNKHLNTQKVAVLAALNLADEFKKSSSAYDNLVKMIEEEKNI